MPKPSFNPLEVRHPCIEVRNSLQVLTFLIPFSSFLRDSRITTSQQISVGCWTGESEQMLSDTNASCWIFHFSGTLEINWSSHHKYQEMTMLRADSFSQSRSLVSSSQVPGFSHYIDSCPRKNLIFSGSLISLVTTFSLHFILSKWPEASLVPPIRAENVPRDLGLCGQLDN